MKRISFKKSPFAQNVFILLTGSLISQVLPFLMLPILQKYFYKPADFGILTVFISMCEIFSSIACLKMEFAIVVQRTIRNAINTAFAAMKIAGFMTLFSLLIVVLFKNQLSEYYNEPKLANYLFLLPIYVFLVGTNDVLSYWFNRKKKFKTISSSKVVQTSFAETLKLTLGYLRANYVGLLLGRLMGFFFSGCYLVWKFMKEDRRTLQLITHKESNQLVKANKQYVIFTTPSVFVNSLINLIYLNLFISHFGKDIAGLLGVSMTYLSAGFGVISVSFSQVFFSKVSEIIESHHLLQVYKQFAKQLALFALGILALIYLIPTKLVVYLLGNEWNQLMEVARIMAVWLSISFISSSLSFIYIRLGRQKEMLLFDCLHLLLILIGFFTARLIDTSLTAALWGFSISQSVYYLFAIFIAIYFIKKSKQV
ncbi:lipopolysaccharide biosynthesis protein [Fluviicola sp.]|uniref:lipopolysaccharide biosynthesis protein n=1 Tax=Fluviicola sp. TaxID=1917219 RepID=UPI003D2C657F